MYRFVLSPRWIGFAVFVVLFAALCTRLGFWQLDRYHQRLAENDVVRANIAAEPVGIDRLDGPGRTPSAADEYREVRLRGTYDASAQVSVKYQTRDAGPGVDVVTPLVLESGRAVLVDRGWMPSDNTGGRAVDLPDPPDGPVTVVGWWRTDSGADRSALVPSDGQVRAISSRGFAGTVDAPLHRGYVALQQQAPAADTGLDPEPQPDLGIGPSLFYSWQWWFFALLAVVGYVYFAWAEAHPARRRREVEPAERPESARTPA